ncbi:hypothetical protein PF001_g33519 [Phytophthora fragariae]|uniref:Uncharacterized protein n=1 Tax=Phytophthora fragariae TaxID=53985 RepID=A0A6A4A4B5_9STRA|nr:hypothetical protein PF001_g33519 [Phytophthora fragariae]
MRGLLRAGWTPPVGCWWAVGLPHCSTHRPRGRRRHRSSPRCGRRSRRRRLRLWRPRC